MQHLLNTLYVTMDGTYVRQDHDTVRVEDDGELRLEVPVHHLGTIVCFGNVLVSPGVIHRCAEDGRALVFLDRNGRFRARLQGRTQGNVLLRLAQYRAAESPQAALALIRSFVAGKIQNARQGVMRSARDAEESAAEALRQTAARLAESLERLGQASEPDEARGVEGNAARAYFETFGLMVRANREEFQMAGRSRRPPRDRMNALLSFLYTLLTTDCVAAVEGVGLDPQVGFLHAVRPGRPSLALDLVEEFRPVLGDRLGLTLVNLRQIGPDDFEERDGGAVYLSDGGRRKVLQAYQERKKEEILHPLLGTRMALGLVPHMQARILARYLRNELEAYVPFLYR